MPHSNVDVNVAVSVGQATTPAPPTRKRRRRPNQLKINNLSDTEAWPLENEQIAAADIASWKSSAYDHFDIALERHPRHIQTNSGNSEVPGHFEYVFTCKTHPETHVIRRVKPTRDRMAFD
ncbi:hypothetical protein FRC09_000056 [Ceratobasidium sp. 395]|nr:hypothetical protein FRC09_000056 [Ceratobasidium sp. 395]